MAKLNNTHSIIQAIQAFLDEQLKQVLKKEIAEMKKITEMSIKKKEQKLQEDYNYRTWIESFQNSIVFMKEEALSFATHTSKGIHSSVKSDNIIFLQTENTLPEGIVGSQHNKNPKIDANSNNTGSHAGHLKNILSILNVEYMSGRLYQFIINGDAVCKEYFISIISDSAYSYLQDLLRENIQSPKIEERNKQILLPVDKGYVCFVPLYPASLANSIFDRINTIRYSETAKQAREERKNGKGRTPYTDILEVAVTKLGGDNAQNVSRLNNEQSGRNYLLPSLPPPTISKYMPNYQHDIRLSKYIKSIFQSKRFVYQTQKDIKAIFAVVKDTRNNQEVRDKRKEALAAILHNLFAVAEFMRSKLPAGWSKEYQLDMHQKLWLDPKRAELIDEEDFATKRKQTDWINKVIEDFATWINALLKDEFVKHRADFSDDEYIEWEREIEAMKKRYERMGRGVFL